MSKSLSSRSLSRRGLRFAFRLTLRRTKSDRTGARLRFKTSAEMMTTMTLLLVGVTTAFWSVPLSSAEPSSDYYHDGERVGSLKTERPLPIYHPNPEHIWNRLFAAFYTRISRLPSKPGGEPINRIEGGDYIDFLAWGRTAYWSSAATANRLNGLLDEFLNDGGVDAIDEPIKRAVLLRDLWAAHDFFVEQNMRRLGSIDVRRRRTQLCLKLARVIQSLALPRATIERSPDTYAAAIRSGQFAAEQDFTLNHDYLPHGLMTDPENWVEVDFYQPNLHEDLFDRFITLHARAYRGRSYFRIFYRFPGGRRALTAFLKTLDEQGVDWRQAAQDGFILLKDDAPQIPVGTQVALVQFMMTLDDTLQPVPTKIVESVRHRTFRNVDGASEPRTNTGFGMHIMEYTLKRRLLFDNLDRGGLEREPDDAPLYRIIFQPRGAPDWGTDQRKTLFQQCADCHMTPKADRLGVHSMPSIVHMGGFDAGAQLGIVHPLSPKESHVRGRRVARWKSQHETYRRLLESLEGD